MTTTVAQSISTDLPINELTPNPLNIRTELGGLDELADSIRQQGVLQPLLVTLDGVVGAGHRRLAAAKLAGLTIVPCVMRELSTATQLEIMLTENLQRENLSVMDEARAYQRLITEVGGNASELSRRIGVPPSRITARLLLLGLDNVVQTMLDRGDLAVTLAPTLARLHDPLMQRQVALTAVRQQMPAAVLDKLVRQKLEKQLEKKEPRRPPIARTPIPAPPVDDGRLSPGRAAMVLQLQEHADRQFALRDLAVVFNQVCCSCGMSDLPAYCEACPMVQLVDRLVNRA